MAEITAAAALLTALRQYQHNDGSGLVPGYELEETQRIVAGLLASLAAKDAEIARLKAPEGKISVSAEPLRQVLQALVGAPHMVRELQATREPVTLFADNPINALIAEFNAAQGGDK